MKLNISSESIFRSAYSQGQFNLDPNRMIQLMFSLDKSLTQFVNAWNEDVYGLFQSLFQEAIDIDAWKVGVNSTTIPVTTDPSKVKQWWNMKRSRPYSILEALESITSLVMDVETLLGRITKLTGPVVRKYLTTRFTDLLDTPSNYQASSLARYSEFNKEIVYIPFLNLGLALPPTFVGLDDTPASFTDTYVLAVNQTEDGVEFHSPGYTTRKHILPVNNLGLDLGTLSNANYVLVCDDTVGSVTLHLNPPFSFFDPVFSIVVPSFTNGVNLLPTSSTFEGSFSVFSVTTSPFTIAYDPILNDFKEVGEHI